MKERAEDFFDKVFIFHMIVEAEPPRHAFPGGAWERGEIGS